MTEGVTIELLPTFSVLWKCWYKEVVLSNADLGVIGLGHPTFSTFLKKWYIADVGVVPMVITLQFSSNYFIIEIVAPHPFFYAHKRISWIKKKLAT